MLLRVFLAALFLISLPTLLTNEAEANNTTETTNLPIRFTGSWAHHYYQAWKIDALELQWKFPKQHSIIKTSIGGTKKRLKEENMVAGDLDAHLLGEVLSIELPQNYSIEKVVKTQLWQGLIDYEYYFSLYDNTAWKFDYDLYYSMGIGGLLDIEMKNHKYTYHLQFDAEQELTDTISIPGGTVDTNFSFFIPGCLNFDFSILTVKGCGMFNIEDPKDSSGYWSFGFGF